LVSPVYEYLSLKQQIYFQKNEFFLLTVADPMCYNVSSDQNFRRVGARRI
jgi:hypothetical protein